MLRGALIALSCAFVGCVQDVVLANDRGDGATSVSDGGDGRVESDAREDAEPNGTLVVTGQVEATNAVPNAQQATDFQTRFEIQVSQGGDNNVSGAIVTITTASSGVLTLTESNGVYVTSQNAYDGTYVLDVTTQSASLHAIMVAGPPFHAFSQPMEGDSLSSGDPLTVQWNPSGAPSASIETSHLSETAIVDNGMYVVPASAFSAESGLTVDDYVRVRRRQSVPFASGSSLQFEIVNRVDIVVHGT